MRILRLALMGVVGLAGCGDSGVVVPGDGSTDLSMADLSMPPGDMTIPDDFRSFVSATQFDKDFAQAICAHLIMCNKLDNTQSALAACIERNTATEGTDRDTEVMKGRLMINELQCLSAIQNARCDGEDQGKVFVSLCAQLLNIPLQGIGGACVATAECTSGYCARGELSNDAGVAPEGCPGTCKSFLSLGAQCQTDESCNTDVARCDSTSGQCVAKPGAGQACANPNDCQVGLFCDPVSGQCVNPTSSGAAGDSCNPFESLLTSYPTCAVGLYCKYNFGATPPSGKCTAKIASGANCTPGDTPFPFADNQCTDGLACYQTTGQAAATCQPWAGLNQPCDPTNDTCKETLYCDSGSKTCKALIADNSACDPTNDHCLSGSKFGFNNCLGSGTNGLCKASKNFGDACNAPTDDVLCGFAVTATGPNGQYCSPSSMTCSVQCM